LEPTSLCGSGGKGFNFGPIIKKPGSRQLAFTHWLGPEAGALPVIQRAPRHPQKGGGFDLAQTKP
jgi:hypothetical protein